jgi:hypothetical protein
LEIFEKIGEVRAKEKERQSSLSKRLQIAEQKRIKILLKNKEKLERVILKEYDNANRVVENSLKIKESSLEKNNQVLAKQYYSLEKSAIKEEILNINKKNI